jgi:hypothetical protein
VEQLKGPGNLHPCKVGSRVRRSCWEEGEDSQCVTDFQREFVSRSKSVTVSCQDQLWHLTDRGETLPSTQEVHESRAAAEEEKKERRPQGAGSSLEIAGEEVGELLSTPAVTPSHLLWPEGSHS